MSNRLPTVLTLMGLLGATLTACGPPPAEALTIAFTGTSNEPAPSIETFRELVENHATSAYLPGDGVVTVVHGGDTTTIDLTPMRGENVEANSIKAEHEIQSHLENFQSMLLEPTTSPANLDVIGVLDRALDATAEDGRVALVTSGFATAAPVDLNAAGGWIADPDGFVDAVDPANLPDAAGKHIFFIGLGYPYAGSDQQFAGPAARDALTTIWLGLCHKMGAKSCSVTPGPPGSEAPTATGDTPTVNLDRVDTNCVGQISLDTSIAFEPDSAELTSGADIALSELANSLSQCQSGTRVSAVGHSAEVPAQRGDTSGAEPLEVARAQAVLNRLLALAVPPERIGKASAGGQLIDNMPEGTFHEDLAARNRQVILVIG